MRSQIRPCDRRAVRDTDWSQAQNGFRAPPRRVHQNRESSVTHMTIHQGEGSAMRHGLVRGALIAAAVLAAAACSNGTPAAPTGTTTTTASASPAATASKAQPETAAAATAVARQYLGLYSAGQFALSWTLLAPSAQRAVSQATWVAVHRGCPSQAARLAYNVKDTTLTGSTAVVTVTLAGAAASLASESESLTYSSGQWGFVPSDLSYYRHGSVKADIAAAKAAGYCASS